MLQLRFADADDVAAINGFYATSGLSAQALSSETLLLALDQGVLIGAVRLCDEEGVLVLRTMHVANQWQRCGIGSRMLRALVDRMDARDCWCIPFAHLTSFYGRVGFEVAPDDCAPLHLRQRASRYRAKGEAVAIMKRAAAQQAG